MEVFRVFATLGLDRGEFDRGLDAAESRFNSIGQAFTSAGRTMTMAVTAPVVGFGTASLIAAGNFEAAMNQVAAVSGATDDELVGLQNVAKDMGATTQFSASQAAEAMGFMAMAGMDAGTIIEALPNVLTLAASANLDMARAADIVTNVMAGFGQTTDQLPASIDVLVAAFTNANTDLDQLAEAMKYAGPIASAAGIPFEEAAAAIAMMGNAGIQGSMAGTSLRGAISRLLNPTEAAATLLRDAGISATDAEGRLRPLDEIIRQLEPHADDAGLMMEVFGQRAGPAMAALVSQGSGALTDLTGTLRDSGGLAQEVADVQMEGLNGSLRLLKSAVEALMIAVAESGLIDWVTGMISSFAEWVQNLSETNPLLLRIGTIASIVVAAIGPLLLIVGQVATGIASLIPLLRLARGGFVGIRLAAVALSGPIGWIVAGVAALVAAFATDFMGIRTAVETQFNAIRDSFQRWGEVISTTVESAKGLFRGFVEWAGAFFGDVPGQFLQFGRDIVEGLTDGITGMLGDAREAIGDVAEGVTGWFKNLLGIESPSTVFRGYGVDIGQGLADGIDEGSSLAVSAVERMGNAIKAAGQAVIAGAFTTDNIVAGIVGNLDGQNAARAIQDRLALLRDERFRAGSMTGTAGRLGRNVIDTQIDALNTELQRLRETLRQTTTETQRAGEVQASRFARSISVFDSGVRQYTLARQRY